jgi:uncharacterized protein YycO
MTLIIKPGDILMVRTNHFVSRLIRFGQRGYGKPASEYNHCAVCIGNFEIVEALTGGVVRSPISKYPASDVRVLSPLKSSLRPPACDELLRANAISFAISCVGEKYGFLTIFAIAVKVLTKGKIDFNIQGTTICSGLAARSLERMGYNFQPYNPAELTPAYLDLLLSPAAA